MRTRRAILIFTVVLTLFFPLVVYAQQTRLALVIGNAHYSRLPAVDQLRNPVNDARDMAAELRQLGFKVDLLTNAGLQSMEDSVAHFGEQLSESKDSVGFFYYAGHGVQLNGSNYLIPSDAYIAGPGFLSSGALQLQSVLDSLQQASNRLNIVVLDACRNNPFHWARSLGGNRGLAVVGSQPQGSIVAYAAAAGRTAEDGTGPNGVYTGELLRYLERPGIDVLNMFREVGQAVYKKTSGLQNPAIYNQFNGSFYLVSKPGNAKIAGLEEQKQALGAQLGQVQRTRERRGRVGGILSGAGVVASGVAVLFYFLASKELSSLQSATSASDASSHLSKLNTDSGVSVTSAIAGAGALISGGVLFLLRPSTSEIQRKIAVLDVQIASAGALQSLGN